MLFMSLEFVVNAFKAPYIWMIVSTYLGLIWFGLILYTWVDIKDRSRSRAVHISAAFLVLVGGIFGLFLYMFLRPRLTLAESAQKRLEEKLLIKESLEGICPTCGFVLEKDYIFCPSCSQSLKKVCLACNRVSQINWPYCPYCSGRESRMVGMEELRVLGIIKRERGRPRKLLAATSAELKPKRPRGRPRKYPLIINDEDETKLKRSPRYAPGLSREAQETERVSENEESEVFLN